MVALDRHTLHDARRLPHHQRMVPQQNQPLLEEAGLVEYFSPSPAIPTLAAVLGFVMVSIFSYSLWRYIQHRRSHRAASSAFTSSASSTSTEKVFYRTRSLSSFGLGRSKSSNIVVLPLQPPTPYVPAWRPPTLTPRSPFAPPQHHHRAPVTLPFPCNLPPKEIEDDSPLRQTSFKIEKQTRIAQYPTQPVVSPPPHYGQVQFPRSRSPPPSFSTIPNTKSSIVSAVGSTSKVQVEDFIPPPSPIRASSLVPSAAALSLSVEIPAVGGEDHPPVPTAGIPLPLFPRLMTVTSTFQPTLEDELVIKLGETLRLLEEYQDGWCLAQRVGTIDAKRGAVPRFCLTERTSMIFVPGVSGNAVVRTDSDARRRAIEAKKQEKAHKIATRKALASQGDPPQISAKRSRFSSWGSTKSPISPASSTDSPSPYPPVLRFPPGIEPFSPSSSRAEQTSRSAKLPFRPNAPTSPERYAPAWNLTMPPTPISAAKKRPTKLPSLG